MKVLKMRRLIIFLLALATLSFNSVTGVALAIAENYVEGDALVMFNPSVLRTEGASLKTSSTTTTALAGISAVVASSNMDISVVKTYDALSELSCQSDNTSQLQVSGALKTGRGANANEAGIFALVHSDTCTTEELVAKLLERDDVLRASPNYIVHTSRVPNDPAFNRVLEGSIDAMWGIKAVNAPAVWDTTTGSSNVYVAVIDTGIDSANPDLMTNVDEMYSKRFYDVGGYIDDHGHGTHVAGTIAAIGNNGTGIAGINWAAKLMALKAMDYRGDGEVGDIIAALNYVAENLDKVNIAAINMSLEYYSPNAPAISRELDPLWAALKALDKTDKIVIVVAAGNYKTEIGAPTTYSNAQGGFSIGYYCYPASFLGLGNFIPVSAIDIDGTKAHFSNYSKDYVLIAAPGVNILSTARTGLSKPYVLQGDNTPLTTMDGTSMAAPHVSGAVALLKSAYPKMTASQITNAIMSGANSRYGTDFTKYGLLDIKGALDILASSISTSLTPKDRNGRDIGENIKAADGRNLTRIELNRSDSLSFKVEDWSDANGKVIKVEKPVVYVRGVATTFAPTVNNMVNIPLESLTNKTDDQFEIYVKAQKVTPSATTSANSDIESDHIGVVVGKGILTGTLESSTDTISAGSVFDVSSSWENCFESVAPTSVTWAVNGRTMSAWENKTAFSLTSNAAGTYQITATGTYNGLTTTTDPVTVVVTGSATGDGGGGGGCSAGGLGLAAAGLAALVAFRKVRK